MHFVNADCHVQDIVERWSLQLDRQESYDQWMTGNVQIMVATKAFGLGIDKRDIWDVIRNGVQESLSEWIQEAGHAGRDGLPSTACIFYQESDLDRAGAWIKDHIRNPSIRDDIQAVC